MHTYSNIFKLFSIIFVTASIFSVKTVTAQSSDGIFGCIWGRWSDGCNIDISSHGCLVEPTGDGPEDSWCRQFNTRDECEGLNGNPKPQNACGTIQSVCWVPDNRRPGDCMSIGANPDGTCPQDSFEDYARCINNLLPNPLPIPITPVATRAPNGRPIPQYDLCALAPAGEKTRCEECVCGGSAGCAVNEQTKGIYTAIGCIKTDTTAFIVNLVGFAIGMAGGIALLIMLYGAFIMATAMGDPEKVQAGKQTIGAAIAGLLTVIFAGTILQIAGINILQLPGLL